MRIRRLVSWLSAACVLLAAALLIGQTLGAATSGASPVYTAADAARRLGSIAWPMGILGAVLAFCCIISAVCPVKPRLAPPLRPAPEKPVKHVNRLRLGLYGLAALLILLGIFNGGMQDVLTKAIKICTECIGLG
jgi:hypothetical protein